MNQLVSILIITMNRKDELFEVLDSIKLQQYNNYEIIIAENGSTKEIIKEHQNKIKLYPNVQYHILPENLGVSGGRNYLLKISRGDIIIEIDDDASFVHEDSIIKVITYFDNNPSVGIQAFKSINFYTNQVDRNEFPFRNKKYDPQNATECMWFIGVGHAFTRELIDKIGIYRDFFPWGSEEQDYALRALNANYKIVFRPDIKVLHKKSPYGRIDNPIQHGSVAFNNMMKIPAYNLPPIFFLSYLIIRGSQFIIKYKSLTPIIDGLKLLFSKWATIKIHRQPISFTKSIKLLFQGARILF